MKNFLKISSILLAGSMTLLSCSDDFLDRKPLVQVCLQTYS